MPTEEEVKELTLDLESLDSDDYFVLHYEYYAHLVENKVIFPDGQYLYFVKIDEDKDGYILGVLYRPLDKIGVPITIGIFKIDEDDEESVIYQFKLSSKDDEKSLAASRYIYSEGELQYNLVSDAYFVVIVLSSFIHPDSCTAYAIRKESRWIRQLADNMIDSF